MKKKPRILAIYTDWNINNDRLAENSFGGVTYYRLHKPIQALSEYFDIDLLGKEITTDYGDTPAEIWGNLIPKYDLIWIKQVDNRVAISNLLAAVEHFGKKLIIDFDDNYLDVLPGQPAYEYFYPGSEKMATVGTSMALANGMMTSTEPLKKKYKDHVKKTHNVDQTIDVLPNFNDYTDWMFKRKEHKDDKVRIGYAGSTTHNADLEIVIPHIINILKKYPQAQFEILGSIAREAKEDFLNKFGDVKDRVFIFYGTPRWEGYPKLLCNMGWDIGVAPLEDNDFTRSKSHIKWMEYAMAGVPTIASKVYPYYRNIGKLKTIVDGETGFLGNWEENLSKLIENKKLRRKIATNASEYIKENWQWKDNINKWVRVLNKYI